MFDEETHSEVNHHGIDLDEETHSEVNHHGIDLDEGEDFDETEVIDDSGNIDEDVMNEEGDIIDGGEVIDDSTEVYEDESEVMDNNLEYDYDEGEEDGMEEQDEYSFGYSHSVEKRPRMSSDAEVVLDSGDEDDEPLPPSRIQSSKMPTRQNNTLQKQQLMSHAQSNSYSQQDQLASQFQPRMPYSQQYLRPQVQAFNGANPLYASQQQVNVRKRKLPSSALCIKDGRVFMKSFTQLPDALLGHRSDNSNQDMQHSAQSAAPKPNTFNPYKTFASQDYRPRHPIEVYSSNIQHRDKATKSLIQGHETSGILQQRIRQLPPGIIVQKNQTRTESRGR